MRVLFVVPGSYDGVSMEFVREEIASLSKAGLQSTTFHLPVGTGRRPIQDAVALRAAVRSARPDIVHAQFGSWTAFASLVAAWGVPLIITLRGSDINPSPSDGLVRSSLQKLLTHASVCFASGVVCVSSELGSRLLRKPLHLRVMPSAVDLGVFSPISMTEARARVRWSEHTPVVLFNAGRTSAVKRLDLATEAMRIVRCYMPDVHFEVMNGGVAKNSVPTLMSAADVLLVTSDHEGSPTVVREALACNLPVVSVDVGDVRSQLSGVEPSAIAQRTPADLARALTAIIQQRQRSNGRQVFAARQVDTTAALLELYRSVLARDDGRRDQSRGTP